MAPLGLLLALCAAAPAAWAQGSRKDDIVLGPSGRPIAGATVRVCTAAATGQPCAPLASIYSDVALTVPLANPMVADGLGNYSFYAVPGRYLIEISGSGITTKQLANVILPSDPNSPSFGNLSASAVTATSVSLTGNLSATGTVTASNITPGTIAAGESPQNDAYCWVSPNGSDANNGLSQGHAKQHIYNCLTSLPGASATTAGSGTIFVTQGNAGAVSPGGPVASQGIWIMGSGDPNYGNPPSGWLKEGSGGLSIIGYGKTSPGNGTGGATVEVQANGNSLSSPALWLAGTGNRYLFRNIGFNAAIPARIGVDSNGNRTTGAAVGPTKFENCSFDVSFQNAVGSGPALDIGSNVLWVWLDHPTFNAVGQQTYAISSVARASNVVTVTLTSGPGIPFWQVGQSVILSGVTDATYNGIFTIAAVADGNHFTFNETGSNGSSSGGTAALSANNDNRAAMVVNTGGASASGLIHIEDAVSNGGGGLRFHSNMTGTGSFYARNWTEEGTGNSQPVIEVFEQGVWQGYVENIGLSDSGDFPPAIRVAAGNPSNFLTAVLPNGAGAIPVEGPMTIINPFVPSAAGAALSTSANAQADFNVSPLAKGQFGLVAGRSLFGSDAHRRSFAPNLARFANLAPQQPSSWSVNTGSVTINFGAAPDTTNNAGYLTSTADGTGGISSVFAYNAAHTLAIGDYIYFGVWAQQGSAAGVYQSQSSNAALALNFPSVPPALQFITGSYGAAGLGAPPSAAAVNPTGQTDGGWQWIWGLVKILALPNGANNTTQLQLSFQKALPMNYFAPMLVQIPSASLALAAAPTYSTASEAGTTVTVTTTAAHKLAVAEPIIISGCSIAGYNGLFAIQAVPSSTTFTYNNNANIGLAAGPSGCVITPVNDSEAVEIAANMATYSDALPAGATIATLRNETLAFGGSTPFFGTLTHNNTANRSYSFPDIASANIPAFTGSPSNGNCAKWGSGGLLQDFGSPCNSGGGSGVWSALTNPTANLALSMGAFTNSFTSNSGASVGTQWSFADTWNSGSYAGPWAKWNFTDTSSAAAAQMFTWQIGGADRIVGDKTGTLTLNNILSFKALTGNLGTLSHANTAARTWTFPDTSQTVAVMGGFSNVGNFTATGTITAANFTSTGTGPVDLNQTALTVQIANNGTTGTTANKLAKLTGAPSTAVIAATTDTTGIIGVVFDQAGTTGNARIAVAGTVNCVFDGATTAGDYVQISSTTAGDCHDAGSSFPASGQVLGRVLSTNAAGGTFAMVLQVQR